MAWLRVDTQTILTIAGHVITKNHRISVSHGDGAWTLGLKDVGPADGGRYMCQVNTEPMMSQTHQLQVVGQQTWFIFISLDFSTIKSSHDHICRSCVIRFHLLTVNFYGSYYDVKARNMNKWSIV